jgi:hypothetical protein
MIGGNVHGGQTYAEGHRLALLVAWDSIASHTTIDTIVHNPVRMAQLYSLLPNLTFWVPVTEYYIQGELPVITLRKYMDIIRPLVRGIPLEPERIIVQSKQLNAIIRPVNAGVRYGTSYSGIAYLVYFFTLRESAELRALIYQHDLSKIPPLLVEGFIGFCHQNIAHGHGVVILQAAMTLQGFTYILGRKFGQILNVSPLNDSTVAAYTYIEKQLLTLKSYVRFKCPDSVQRIPGYVAHYHEVKLCVDKEIIKAAQQGDAPSVVAPTWIQQTTAVYEQSIKEFRATCRFRLTTRCPILLPKIISVNISRTFILPVLVTWYGIGGVYEPRYYPHDQGLPVPNLSNWHGQAIILIDTLDYPLTDLVQFCSITDWEFRDRVHFYIISSSLNPNRRIETFENIYDIYKTIKFKNDLITI